MLKSKEILEDHTKMHSWDHKFRCVECGNTSSTPNDLKNHKRKVYKYSIETLARRKTTDTFLKVT